jgi:hypothetical protein
VYAESFLWRLRQGKSLKLKPMKNLFLLIPTLFIASIANAWERWGTYTPVRPHVYECKSSNDLCMRSGDFFDPNPSVGDRILINKNGKEVQATIIAITHSETREQKEEIPVDDQGMYEFDYEISETE